MSFYRTAATVLGYERKITQGFGNKETIGIGLIGVAFFKVIEEKPGRMNFALKVNLSFRVNFISLGHTSGFKIQNRDRMYIPLC